jgi:hypothetical protein
MREFVNKNWLGIVELSVICEVWGWDVPVYVFPAASADVVMGVDPGSLLIRTGVADG